MMLSVQDLPVNESEEVLDKLTRLLDMAFWHNEAGNQDAAITAAEAALAINSNSTTAHSLLGTLYEKRGDDAQAIAHFESVLALNPDSAADAAKLDQLQRGVHVRAVTPPAAHLWLPPGLVRLSPKVMQKWSVLTASVVKQTDKSSGLPRRPLYAAGAAAVLVLATGLLLLRPWARADAGTLSAPAMLVTAPASTSVGRSAFAGNGPAVPTNSPPTISPPMVLTAAPATVAATYSPVYYPPARTGPDPFAGTVPTMLASRREGSAPSPVWSLPAVPRLTAAARRRLAHRDLPALRLTALPAVGTGELAPAPISLPEGVPLATVAGIPQHTVVVNSLGQSAVPGFDSGPVSASHIHITVRNSSPSDTDPAADSGEGGGEDAAKADTYQQRALSLQQGGDFGQARAAYQRAIRAYQSQIASGHEVETAQRGLAACQTGLQICQQSQ